MARRLLCFPPVGLEPLSLHPSEKKPTTSRKLAGFAKQAGKLLLIELLMPGGTLVVLAILLAGGSLPGLSSKLAALLSLPAAEGRPGHGVDLVASNAK